MLSVLTSLSVSTFRKLDTEIDKFCNRGHTFYETVLLIRGCTLHALKPYIDSDITHERYFITSSYVNKGMFIDLLSIFRDNLLFLLFLLIFLTLNHP